MSYNINHNPFVRKRIISIDSRFRDPVYNNPSDFVYHLSFPIRNVISVRLSSIEYPNTYFVFSESKGNTTMKIRFPTATGGYDAWIDMKIADGNYTTIPGDTSSLLMTLQTAIRSAYSTLVSNGHLSDPTITMSISPTTGHVTISSLATGIPFELDFSTGKFNYRTYDWGVGYNLGFANKQYFAENTSFTGTSIIDTIGAAYVFFTMNGIEPIQHYSPEKNVFSAFAKLLMVGDKNSIVYDDGSSFITKEYRYTQPVDFFLIHPQIVDTYGDVVDLNGKNYSFTLELEEVTNVAAYKQYRDNAMTMPSDWVPTFSV
jgi:hypothetical protein